MRTRILPLLAIGALVGLAACQDDDDGPAAPDTGPGPPEEEEAEEAEAWSTLAPAPVELTEIDAAAFGGELWTAGGYTDGPAVTPTVLVFDPETDEWREGPALPEGVHHASLVATDTDLVLVGGYEGVGFDPVADVLVLDEENDTWVEGPSLPEPRGAGGAAWDGERIVYGGGVGDDGLADEVWALDDLDGEWSEVGRLSIARDHLDATSDGDGTVWFLAGREGSLEANLGTVDLLDGDEIRAIGEIPTPRGGVAAFFSDAHGACVAGGEAPDGTFEEVECIDADGATTVLPPLGQPRHGIGADVIGGSAYVALGGPEPLLAVSGTLETLRVTGG